MLLRSGPELPLQPSSSSLTTPWRQQQQQLVIAAAAPAAMSFLSRFCSQLMSSPVYTINCGLCASSASLLLAGGTPGHRYALEGSRVLLHLPMGALGGPLAELQQEAEDVKRVTQQVARLYG